MVSVENRWAMPVTAGALAATVGVAALAGERGAAASEVNHGATTRTVGEWAMDNTVTGVVDSPDGKGAGVWNNLGGSNLVAKIPEGHELEIACQVRDGKAPDKSGNNELQEKTWYRVTSWDGNDGNWDNKDWNKDGDNNWDDNNYHENSYRSGGGDDGEDWDDGGDGNWEDNGDGDDGDNWDNKGDDWKNEHDNKDWNKDGENWGDKGGWTPQSRVKVWEKVPSCPGDWQNWNNNQDP